MKRPRDDEPPTFIPHSIAALVCQHGLDTSWSFTDALAFSQVSKGARAGALHALDEWDPEPRVRAWLARRNWSRTEIDAILGSIADATVLSGSAVLQMLVYGEEWPESDVDLFTLVHDRTQGYMPLATPQHAYSLLVAAFGHSAVNETDYFGVNQYQELVHVDSTILSRENGRPVVRRGRNVLTGSAGAVPLDADFCQIKTRKFRSPTTNTLDFVHVNTGSMAPTLSNMFRFIQGYFDLGFCKTCVYRSKTGNLRLWIGNVTAVLERTSAMRPTSINPGRAQQRCAKYRARGFTIPEL